MPRLNSFQLQIKTGQNGPAEPPRYSINGFVIEFEEMSGGIGPGETLEATGNPGSFPHSLSLCGPKEGAWDIEGITATYFPHGEPPYTVRFDAVTLDDQSDLNIWQDRPAQVFDV
ncbi:MAG: helicase [Candidatus Hydrogenedentes bacterium]|nr:helicase [Candidatus Hydrogenedentota bacterium]